MNDLTNVSERKLLYILAGMGGVGVKANVCDKIGIRTDRIHMSAPHAGRQLIIPGVDPAVIGFVQNLLPVAPLDGVPEKMVPCGRGLPCRPKRDILVVPLPRSSPTRPAPDIRVA